jgi:tRNA threonylcarbamoyladenosine biosynthesis protein TsaB
MKYILSLDTTSKYSSIAISKNEKIEIEYNFITNDNLSSMLIPTIKFILETIKLNLNDIDIFGIAIGPGSFTGIRVGLSTLKGLLFEKKRPVVPVVTLKALAYKHIDSNFPIVPVIDAKKEEVYIAGYNFSKQGKIEIISPQLINIKSLKIKLNTFPNLHFVGIGAEKHKDFIKTNFKKSKILVRTPFVASEICKISHKEFISKNFVLDLQDLKPFYLRKPDAEQNYNNIKLKKNQDFV